MWFLCVIIVLFFAQFFWTKVLTVQENQLLECMEHACGAMSMSRWCHLGDHAYWVGLGDGALVSTPAEHISLMVPWWARLLSMSRWHWCRGCLWHSCTCVCSCLFDPFANVKVSLLVADQTLASTSTVFIPNHPGIPVHQASI